MSGWTLQVYDARTGDFRGNLPESTDSTWATGITGTQSSTETFLVTKANGLWGRVDELFKGNRNILVRSWGGHVAYAQKIDDWVYEPDTGKLVVSVVELRGEPEWRLIGGVGTSLTATFTITNKSAGGAIRAALAQMMAWGPAWEFPIDLPADGAGTFSGKWPFWRKQRISDIIKQIEDTFDVELYLRPYLTPARKLRFEAVVQQRVRFAPVKMHIQAKARAIAGVKYRKNFTRQITGLLGVGNGTGQDQATRWAGQSEHDIIIRDTQESIPDLEGAALQAATTNRFNERRRPAVQWTVDSYTVSELWPLAIAAPGRVWQLESRGDGVIPDGIHEVRVIGVSGGNGNQVKVEVEDATA